MPRSAQTEIAADVLAQEMFDAAVRAERAGDLVGAAESFARAAATCPPVYSVLHTACVNRAKAAAQAVFAWADASTPTTDFPVQFRWTRGVESATGFYAVVL